MSFKSIRQRNKFYKRLSNKLLKTRNVNLIKKINDYQWKNRELDNESYIALKSGTFVSSLGIRCLFSKDIPLVELNKENSTKGNVLYKEFKRRLQTGDLLLAYNYFKKNIFEAYMVSYEFIILVRNELLAEIEKRNSSFDKEYIEGLMSSMSWHGEFVLLEDIINKVNEDNDIDITKVIRMEYKLGAYDEYLITNFYKK